jgi:Protein of unknown function (DUF2827)
MLKPIPGMTENFGNPSLSEKPVTTLSAVPIIKDRRVILLATATITRGNLFSNGLFQNVFILYKMFDAMGYAPILIIHEKPKDLAEIPPMLHSCRMMNTEEILKRPIPVTALIEIGMSIDPLVREFVKMLGGKLAKLYLGNILNIDIETPMFYPTMHFAHHVIEKIDRIWVSPHYGQHAEYASYLNHVVPPADLKDMIAPYVWDPCVITRNGELNIRWRPRTCDEEDVIVIMEPNISFQKASLIPLMIVEHWYRRTGLTWKGRVIVCNGNRLKDAPHFSNSILPTLDLHKNDRIEFVERLDIVSALTKWPAAIYVAHQYNNEYNYMALEHLWTGFPLVHNCGTWGEFGYFYKGTDIETGAQQLDAAYRSHHEKAEVYRAHAATLAWRHSPYNPEVHQAWDRLLKV